MMFVVVKNALFRKIQDEIAVVQHQHQGGEEKQKHQDVQDAVTLAAGVLDIFHDRRIVIFQKCAAKI